MANEAWNTEDQPALRWWAEMIERDRENEAGAGSE